MYVLRFFLKTLLFVAVMVGGVLGFIYRDTVVDTTSTLREEAMTVLNEQGWLAVAPVAETPRAPAPGIAAGAPASSGTAAPALGKADYPPDDYSPAGPDADAKKQRPAIKAAAPPPPMTPHEGESKPSA